jgi:glycosyltransferase involved in cell wall biosynthesis
MKIGIDARKIRDFGIGIHIENLIKYIPEFDTENEYIIFHYPEDKDYVPQTSPNISLIPDTSPKYSIRELVVLPFKMWQQRLDLFHATHYTLPPLRPCRGIVTIHDIIHLRFPEYLPHPAAYYYAKGMMWAAAKSARKIITVSECSKQDIVQYLGVPEEKIEVVYNGIDVNTKTPVVERSESLRVLPGSTSQEQTPGDLTDNRGLKERFGISRNYILYLGNFLPHKNHEMLIKAYSLLKRQQKIPHCLVLAGKNKRMRQTLETLISEENLENDVILTGFVESEWLPVLYAHADLFVYPSLYEGFGLQALEAMAYHIPVAISNVAALPEIADDAAIQFDPNSAKDMAEVIYKGLTNQKLRASLIKKGTQRLKCFSWQEMARKMVEIYQYVIRDA